MKIKKNNIIKTYNIMSLYILKENQELLWNFIHTNETIYKKVNKLNNSEKAHWFQNVIGMFYEKNKHIKMNVVDLNKLNKDTVNYMIKDLTRIFSMNQTNSLQPTHIEREVKQNQYMSDYQRRQQEYNEMVEKKVPTEVNFQDNYEKDEALTNIDELIKKQMAERELDLQIITNEQNPNNNPVLKIDGSSNVSIEADVLESNYKNEMKKSVSWSENLEDCKEDSNVRMEELEKKYNEIFKSIEDIKKENRELVNKMDELLRTLDNKEIVSDAMI